MKIFQTGTLMDYGEKQPIKKYSNVVEISLLTPAEEVMCDFSLVKNDTFIAQGFTLKVDSVVIHN
jgi:hypothetical protein